MLSEVDNRKGLVKTYWKDIRDRVEKVEPQFTKIVDSLDLGKAFPLYLAYYPYGAIDADTESTLFPDAKGGYYRLTDANVSKDVLTNLGYSKNNTPLAMVLDKQLESFIDFKNRGITIPWIIYTPGKMFPFTRILNSKKDRVYAPNGLLSSTAGARSVFMLPNIGCSTNHINLQRDFNVQQSAPKSLYDHWSVFKEIINSSVIDSDWRCCVMYFSEEWISKIHNDRAWSELKQYLHHTAWHQFEYEINRIHYDIIFSMIQQNRNLKPNPYLTDTAKHLFAIATGAVPGYAPALNNDSIPLETLQKVYVESYGLKKYFPTIMQPVHFNLECDTKPVYYSMQNPSTYVFSPKSREVSSTLYEMRELHHIMRIFIEELANKNGMCADTIVGKIALDVKFHYFHNKTDLHQILLPSQQITQRDIRFSSQSIKYKNENAIFSSDATFLRGCISISRANN